MKTKSIERRGEVVSGDTRRKRGNRKWKRARKRGRKARKREGPRTSKPEYGVLSKQRVPSNQQSAISTSKNSK